MVKSIAEMLGILGSALGGLMFIWTIFKEYLPDDFRGELEEYKHKLFNLVSPNVEITFPEFVGQHLKRSEAFFAIQNYLGVESSSSAKKLKADVVKGSDSLVLSLDDHEEVIDEFQGVKLWWSSKKECRSQQSFSLYPQPEGLRYFKLTFHKRDRSIVTGAYIKHVLDEGKTIAKRKQHRKLYSNISSDNWYGYKSSKWSHVVFQHPATFDTLAMDPVKKKEILNDLDRFRDGKQYYKKIGKAWKRGYLLYGPPGTGKSTMIAAMSNYLNYDVYDIELTSVKDNTELRKLLIDSSNKSIIVIEDIDCSLDLTGQREKKDDAEKDDDDKETDPVSKKIKKEDDKKSSKVTLSGLLNFIDGLWSACGSERILVFTTNYIDKLDPALIRRGRMDKHIEMSYCCFESFKLLAKNYLDIENHALFDDIKNLLEEVDISPADVAENLLSKSDDVQDYEFCLNNLIEALKFAREEAKKKAEEESRVNADIENEEAGEKTDDEKITEKEK